MAEAPTPALTQLERSVIALAIRDADAGFLGTGRVDAGLRARLSTMYRKVAGIRGQTPLANPRLETLRRFAGASPSAPPR